MAFPDYTPTLPVMLRELVRRFGPRPMIVLGDRRVTYAEAEAESARLARGLLACGVAKGARVGVLFPNGPDWVIAWLAASRIGAVVVPLNTFYKPRELGYVLRHADVHTLLCARRLLGNDYLERLERDPRAARAEGVAGLRPAAFEPLLEPTHALLRGAVGEGFRHHPAL